MLPLFLFSSEWKFLFSPIENQSLDDIENFKIFLIKILIYS